MTDKFVTISHHYVTYNKHVITIGVNFDYRKPKIIYYKIITIIVYYFIGGLTFQGLWVMVMEKSSSLQSNMKSTRGKLYLSG